MICADFHCHTRYSHDCFASVAAVLDMAKRRGLTHLAITDHDAIAGAFRAEDGRGKCVLGDLSAQQHDRVERRAEIEPRLIRARLQRCGKRPVARFRHAQSLLKGRPT